MAEMEIKREDVWKKRSRSLSAPSPDLVGGDVSLQEWGTLQDQRVGQHQGALSWTHSGSVESFQPVGVTQGHIRHSHRTRGKYCLRGVRVGEAKNPVPIVEEGGEFPMKVQNLDFQGLSTTI